MPVIQSAKKKLRQDRKRTIMNSKVKRELKDSIKDAVKNPTKKQMDTAYSMVDTAVKKNVIHPNKAARLKSQIARANAKG